MNEIMVSYQGSHPIMRELDEKILDWFLTRNSLSPTVKPKNIWPFVNCLIKTLQSLKADGWVFYFGWLPAIEDRVDLESRGQWHYVDYVVAFIGPGYYPDGNKYPDDPARTGQQHQGSFRFNVDEYCDSPKVDCDCKEISEFAASLVSKRLMDISQESRCGGKM